MSITIEQNQDIDLNLILNVSKDGTVLFSNETSEPILNEWGVRVGKKLPSNIVDLVQRVMSRNNPEKSEIKVGNRVYLVVFHPLPEQECINISGFDISDQKESEEILHNNEEKYRTLFNSIDVGFCTLDVFFDKDNKCVDLRQIELNTAFEKQTGWSNTLGKTYHELGIELEPFWYDTFGKVALTGEAIRFEQFVKALGKWLEVYAFRTDKPEDHHVGVFCKDITKRKRAEEALQESEKRFKLLGEANALLLSSKNPEKTIQIIAEKMMHYLKCDVFFNYVLDRGRDRLRLNAYAGINEETVKEIEWLDKGVAICGCVASCGCRVVSEDVQNNGDMRADLVRSMGIQAYACQPLHIGENTIGTLSFGTKSRKEFTEDELAIMNTVADQVSVAIERKRAEEMLAFERSQLLSIFDGMDDMVYVADPYTYEVLYVNKAMKEKFGGEYVGGICYRKFQQRDSPCDFCTNSIIIKERDKPYLWEYHNPKVNRFFMIMDRIIKWPNGRDVRLEIAKDITKLKQAEEVLKKSNETLEEKVKERTSELEKSYNSLKESEKSLAEAQEVAHIGNWSLDIVTGEIKWSDEVYRIFGFRPQEFEVTYDVFFSQVHPEDRNYVISKVKNALKQNFFDAEYRIIRTDRVERVVHETVKVIFDQENNPVQLKGIVQDITERKRAENALVVIEIARKKEIHHRIKNNLQVISSLLDLQADKFNGKKNIDESQVLESFKESQDRVISMALIHEELYKGGEIDTLNFSHYIEKLADNLFLSYRLGNEGIDLEMDIEKDTLFDMDTSIPLGMIINELVSNSLKHAFTGKDRGKIRVKLHREKSGECVIYNDNDTTFILSVSDNGVGIPKDLDIEKLDSLGLQLVTTLVDQLDGELELNINEGAEFIIRFTVKEKKYQMSSTASQN